MQILVNIATIFLVGSIIGYVIEVFYRKIFTVKKWINPGFLLGPYLPIYGFGALVLYGFWNIPMGHLDNVPEWAFIIIRLLIISASMTLLELICGLIFLKFLHLRLWDYRDRKFNFKGVICPLYSLIWTIVGGLYFFFLNQPFITLLNLINNNIIYAFFIGLGIGMMIVDACYAFRVGFKVKKALNDLSVNYIHFREQFKKDKNKKASSVFNLGASKVSEINEYLNNTKYKFTEKLPLKRKKITNNKKDKNKKD